MKRLKEKIKVLYVGDTQVNTTTSSKGMDTWTFSFYSDSARYLRNALNASDDIECVHIPSANAVASMPSTLEEFKKYDAVILSDLGYNNVSFQPGYIEGYVPMGPDRVTALEQYVLEGGGLMMIGGWLSFSGLQGKGLYGGTKIEGIMPVTCEPRGVDDRMEITWGYQLEFVDPEHPTVAGLHWENPYMFLGYNKIHLKKDAHLIASYNGDVQIASYNPGKGRSLVFASDVGPHWAGNFLEWPEYKQFWQQMTRWVAGAVE